MYEEWQNKDIRRALRCDRFIAGLDRRLALIYGRKPILGHFNTSLPSTERAQTILKTLVLRKQPCALIRFGLYERELCRQYLERVNHLRKSYSDFIRYHIEMDAGMFSNDDLGMDAYAEHVLSMLPGADVIAYWNDTPSPKIFTSICDPIKIRAVDLYPYPFFHQKSVPDWQQTLSGKKVLIVTAFASSIEKQYRKRQNLWEDPHILPEFQLTTLQAIQTSGRNRDNRFCNWKQAYQHMLNQILRQSFDIALISCGSYGMPLALELKKHGRKAIQWGGCYQLWFGLIGKRWYNCAEIQPYINPFWTYPSLEETPSQYQQVDCGCYWAP